MRSPQSNIGEKGALGRSSEEVCDLLVLDADMSHTLAVVRSLARGPYQVDVAAHLERPITGRSRHVRNVLTYPDPMTDESAFVAWLGGIAAKYRLVIPVTERSVLPIARSRAKFDPSRLALPPDTALAVALDKTRTFGLAASLGVPAPAGIHITTPEELEEATPGLSFPVVIKPSRSIAATADRMVALTVGYAFDMEELLSAARHALAFGSVLLQEYFRGEGVGIELIADHGEIRYAFQHRRLHEVPLTGGGSSLRESVEIEPALLHAASQLMRALQWHGVAMVEFKRNRETGEFRLMEINGRFWGSLPLAVSAGADFPRMLAELLIDGKVRQRPPARLAVRSCKISSDLEWYEQVLRKEADRRLVTYPSMSSLAADACALLSPRTRFDVQKWSDPWPGIVDLAALLRRYAARLATLLAAKRLEKSQRRSWSTGKVKARLASARTLLFVCYGNINRSALAERYMRQIRSDAQVDVMSAGFHTQSGRPADPVMRDVARERGVDLDNWVSRIVDRQMVESADVIFVMELAHLQRLVDRYPAVRDRTFLLGLASGAAAPTSEVADPYGRSRDIYARCFNEVTACVSAIATTLGESAAGSSQR